VSDRKLSVTITGPEGMLEAMAKLLRDEGYTVIAPGEHAEAEAIMRAGALIEAQLQKRRSAEQRVLDACRDAIIGYSRHGRSLSIGSEERITAAILAWREAL